MPSRPVLLALAVTAFVAIGGVAIARIPASNGAITACYSTKNGAVRIIDSSKKCAKKEKRINWNQTGKTGATGERGATGAAGQNGTNGTNGSNGTPGTNGSPAASMLQGHVNTLITGASGTGYAFPSGVETATSSDEAAHTMVGPHAASVARDMFVRLDANDMDPAAGQVYVFTLRVNGADTGVTCTLQNGARSCDSGAATAAIPADANVSLQHTKTGPTDGFGRPFSFSWRAVTP